MFAGNGRIVFSQTIQTKGYFKFVRPFAGNTFGSRAGIIFFWYLDHTKGTGPLDRSLLSLTTYDAANGLLARLRTDLLVTAVSLKTYCQSAGN